MWHERHATRTWIRAAAWVAVALSSGAPAFSQTVTLVKDINTQAATPADRFQNYGYFGWTGGVVVFNGQNDREGVELWVSNGTAVGTTVLMDINRGVDDSSPQRFTTIGGIVYFSANDGVNGAELWRTDGTPSGTWLVKDIYPGSSSSGPQYLTVSGGQLFFTANDGTHGSELWVSDGSEANTAMVADIRPGANGSSAYNLTATSLGVLFRADDGSNGVEPWISDGTAASTSLVRDVNPGSGSSSPGGFVELGGEVFFAANDGTNGTELWKTSDGTPATTSLVQDIRTGSYGSSPAGLVVFDGALYFAANDGSVGSELWTSDGTSGGTDLVMDIWSGSSGSSPQKLTVSGSTLFFAANDGVNGIELWGLDVGSATPALILDIRPGSSSSSIDELVATSFGVVFGAYDGTHGTEPWKSDGTSAGTVMITDINPGSTSSESWNHGFMSTGPTVFFHADDGTNGDRAWITDGTAAGTTPLTPLAVTTSSGAGQFGTCPNGNLFLNADDQIVGAEPWISDGTAVGTNLLVDLYAGTLGSNPFPREPLGGLLPIIATTPTYNQEVWTTDCTAAGTSLLKDVNPTGSSYPFSWVVAGAKWFFDGIDTTNGRELWVSDGTTAGTVLVQDIYPGTGSSSPIIGTFGSQALFRADDGAVGRELWISDGTPAGTSLVMDIFPGASGSSPTMVTDAGPFSVFWANDGVTGTEPWVSDGTALNTFRLQDINPGADSSLEPYLYYFRVIDGIAYFAANDGTNGTELWRTDGTTGGTAMVKDINPGPDGSLPESSLVVGDRLFFLADDGTAGQELWTSDGTAAGTVMVRDLWPGPAASDSRSLSVVDDLLVIVSRTPDFGEEMWVSDGTTDGTRLLADINPGPTGSGPFPGIQIGNEYVFSADDDEYGRELFSTCADRFYMDTDGDGYGDPNRPTMACTPPSGYVIDDTDCDDTLGGTYPGATEFCDSTDNDCDGEIDDPTFSGAASATALASGSCALRLDWSATTACDGTPVYNVYRSTSSGFTPDASSLQVACVPQSFWIDTAVAAGATYYYVVRAENPSTGGFGPCYGGAEDNNLVERSATVSSSCVAAPQEVLYFSASARDLEVQLEWVNPSGAYGLTRTCWRTGSYPTGPTDGVCVDLVGGAGSYGTTTHDTTSVGGISNGQLYFYAAFVNSSPLGTGDWSTGRFVAARPFDTTGAGKWGYSTAATTMSSPGILPGSASFTASNDRILHSSVAGGAGGNWPSAWVPASMNGPAQDRPIVIPFGAPTVGGASTVAFVGSQDGRAYAFNADTGVELWASDVLGNGVQGSPSGSLTVFGGFHDLIIVGTRTPGGDSQLHGLQLVDGAPAWTFDNGGGSNGIGIISSQPWVDGDTTLATFTSRRKAGGSSDTVWCVEFTATSASLLWSRDLGDIDSAPTVLGGAVFVGTNAGTVYALDPLTGADLWATPYATGDGPIRGYVWFDGTGGGRRLFFSTSSSVHGLTDNGSSSTALWAPVSLADPSPVLVIGDDLYLGSSAANGSLVRLDTTTGVQLGSVTLGDPFVAKNVGSPSYDWVTGQVVVGTEQGVVYAVDDGF